VLDADAYGDQRFSRGSAILPYLKRRSRIYEVQSIVVQPGQPKGLAEPAGARREVFGSSPWSQAPVNRHLRCTGQRLKGAQQHATGFAFHLASNIRAEITSINRVNIGETGRAKDYEIAGCRPAMGVGSRIGRVVVRTKVGFHLDDPAGQYAGVGSVGKDLAEEKRSHVFRRRFKEGSREDLARHFWDARQDLSLMKMAG
jgi:hypothetical protein